MTRKDVGRIGLSTAIQYFTLNGYTVSIPLNDTQWYDMVVEKDGKLYTVQCKATMTETSEIDIRSTGGTNGGVYDTLLNHPELDYIFCVNKDLNCWLIPMQAILDSKVTKSFVLRKELSPMAHPKLDTTLYWVQFPDLV